jgi:regulator of protease activity HflC (stomatin/prohibitin superfamily)
MVSLSTIVLLALVLVVIIVLLKGVVVVSQGYEYTVERFGRYVETFSPGLHFIVPILYRIGHKKNMMEQVMPIPSLEIISADNALVKVDGVAFFQIVDAAKAAYEVSNLDSALSNITMTNLRTVLGSMELDAMLSERDKINSKLLVVVDNAVSPWGIKVNRIEISNIEPPPDLVQAMAAQMKAEREKRALVLEAEGARQAQILKAQGERDAQILAAEGRKASAFCDAEARERLAEAEATATRMVSEAISQGDINAIQYFVAQKYIEALGKIASSDNQKVIMLPMETSSLLGSLSGIQELLKTTTPSVGLFK